MAARPRRLVRVVVPLVFTVLFLMSVLMTSGYLMQGTATEKENKVVEVLLASANPDEILAGKLLGLGAAGLLQIGVWLTMLLVTGLGIVPLLMSARRRRAVARACSSPSRSSSWRSCSSAA